MDEVAPPKSIRMADAAHWLIAAEAGLPVQQGELLKALEDSQTDIMTEKAINDPLVLVLIDMLDGETGEKFFEGTMGELLARLVPDKWTRPDRFFPRTPAHLSTELKRLKQPMEKIGLNVEHGRKTRRGRIVRITMSDELAKSAKGSKSSEF